AKLSFDAGEHCIAAKSLTVAEDTGTFAVLFANGKGVRIPASAYATKSNRRRLTGAYSDASPCIGIFYIPDGISVDILLVSSADRGIIISSDLIPVKTTRSSAGVNLINLKKDQTVVFAETDFASLFREMPKLKKQKIPATASPLPDDFSLPYTEKTETQ
ncbi:MAG: DNA gyrase C-terminal beta-propeller domain-containing protein, partial [Eubacteriales bacterium]